MKHSVRTRIALHFISLIVLALVLIGIVHQVFLGRFYEAEKISRLEKSWTMANQEESSDVSEEFLNFCSVNGLTFAIADSTLETLASNSNEEERFGGRLLGLVLSMDDAGKTEVKTAENYQILKMQDRFQGLENLELWGYLSDGNYYIVTTPLQSISDTVAMSLRFYIYIGIAVVVLSVLVIHLLTGRVTRPIRELSQLSERMADLDFNARYESGGDDEIGEMGRNFNRMSQSLETALTDLKNANLELQRDIDNRKTMEEARSKFLSDVSHELKTPIALIQGYAEGLKDLVAETPEDREFYCEVIVDEAEKMNELVKKLLTLNQLEFGSDQLQLQRFDLTELIQGILINSRILIEQQDARVTFRAEPHYYVWGDAFKIEEVITNYLTNALDHLEGERRIEIKCREEEGHVITSVFNTGNPIPPEELDKIWDKFYKVDKARTRAYGGSGIGLSIVKAIMKAHQQECFVENYENGVAFSFVLESK